MLLLPDLDGQSRSLIGTYSGTRHLADSSGSSSWGIAKVVQQSPVSPTLQRLSF